MTKNPKNLRAALEANDLESFIKEHENDPLGDIDKVEAVIQRSALDMSLPVHQTSDEEPSDD